MRLGIAADFSNPFRRLLLEQSLLDEFFVAPETDVQRENDLKTGEVVTAVVLKAPAPGTTSAHGREADKQAFDASQRRRIEMPLIEVLAEMFQK